MILTLRVLYLLVYIVIASQGIFYFLAVAEACQLMPLEGFIEFRKAVESSIETPLRILYSSAVFIAVMLLLFQIRHFNAVVFYTTMLSLSFLIADILLAVTKSIPLNVLIRNSSSPLNHILYEDIRLQWLYYIKFRGVLSVTGLLTMIVGFFIDRLIIKYS